MEKKPVVLSNRPLRSRKQVQSLMPSLESTFYEEKKEKEVGGVRKKGDEYEHLCLQWSCNPKLNIVYDITTMIS
jgi:hypothetical protein